MFASEYTSFLNNLKPDFTLPRGVKILNPYLDKNVRKLVKEFYEKYFSDSNKRVLIFGINPGRLGGGVTGISFTDPVALQDICGIENNLEKKRELSSRLIYEMIDAFGGPEVFYSKFLLTATSPLGFTSAERNLNYYDNPELEIASRPFILKSLQAHFKLPVKADVIFSLGKKNTEFLNKYNSGLNLFKRVIALEHPRFIMQYRLKRKDEFIDKYIGELKSI